MNIMKCSEKFRVAKWIGAVAVMLSVAVFPALAADEAPPSGHGGSGVMSDTHWFATNSKTITNVGVDYKISWKLWTLLGEPVGDYKLKWTLRDLTINGGGLHSDMHIAAGNIPPALAKEAKSIELYLDGIASVNLSDKSMYDLNDITLVSHAFNTGVATRAGQLSYNTPGSPKWSEVFLKGYVSPNNDFIKHDYLSEKEAKEIFKRSHQPEAPLRMHNFIIGPKSTVSVGDLENRIGELCANPKTAPSYEFCPAIKEKPKKEKEAEKDSIEDAFFKLEKDKGGKASKPGNSDAFSDLDKGKGSKAGQGMDAAFNDVETHRIEVARQREAQRVERVRHEEAARFCEAAFEARKSCNEKAGCGGEPEKTVCVSGHTMDCATGNNPHALYICPYVCDATDLNPKHAEWETCTTNATGSCARHTSARSMGDCVSERMNASRAK